MNREKQIEEMFNIIVDGIIDGEDNNGVPTGNTCSNIAESIYAKGYRKAFEVARDIIEVINALREDCSLTEYHRGCNDALDDFKRALENKYTEG